MMVHYSATPKRGFPWKWLMIAGIVGAAIYYGPGLLHKGGAPAGADGHGGAQGGPPVSVADAIGKPITTWREFSGMLQAVNSVEVRPRVGGQITAIHFKDGEEVKKGQLLFTIDPRPYEAAMISTKGAMSEANATLGRAKKLIASKAISRAEYETAQSAYDRALGAYKSAEVNLDYTRITAPISGKISRAEITVGNVVDPGGQSQLLASIVDLSPIYASFEIDEQTFLSTIQGVTSSKLKTIPVEVSLGNTQSGKSVPATIHSFDNQLTPGSGTIRVRASLPNTDGSLIPGLYARVRLGSVDTADAVLIHPTAVGTDQSKKFVMVVDAEGKANYREITLGPISDGLQVITSGLAAGETIIVNGLQRARPGAPVTGTPVDMTTLQPLNPPADAAVTPGAPGAPAAGDAPTPAPTAE